MKFGEFIKELRLKLGLGLREFCKAHEHDPSNWSKIERGLLAPPNDEEMLEKYAAQLGLTKGDSNWLTFFDLAALERGKLPQDIMSNQQLVDRLPVFFRTIRCQKPTKEDLEELAKLLQGS